MTITVSRVVHSSHVVKFPTKAVTDSGREVEAYVPGLVVELVGDNRTHTEDIVPASDTELAEAQRLFTNGATITVTYS